MSLIGELYLRHDELKCSTFFFVLVDNLLPARDGIARTYVAVVSERLLSMHGSGLVNSQLLQNHESLIGFHDDGEGKRGWCGNCRIACVGRGLRIVVDGVRVSDCLREHADSSLFDLEDERLIFLAY